MLLPNGTVAGCLSNTSDVLETYPSMLFSGGPDQTISAIAMTLDAMFYAISEDTILEYSIDPSSPSNLTYVGQVFP